MEYRAVGNRCAVIMDSLHLPIPETTAFSILAHKGFARVTVDIVALCRQCVMDSVYRRGARPSEAPHVVDCSSLVKWVYGRRGIWLPRRSIQQRELGEPVALTELVAGDVVFTHGLIDYYWDDCSDGVGHAGVATGQGTIIHAANSKAGVVETPVEKFTSTKDFRGARRYLPQGVEVTTFLVPPKREVETADDFRWIILQSLPRE